MAQRITLLVLAILLAALGYFMVWVSQYDEADESDRIGIALFILAGLLVVGVAASWLRHRFVKPT